MHDPKESDVSEVPSVQGDEEIRDDVRLQAPLPPDSDDDDDEVFVHKPRSGSDQGEQDFAEESEPQEQESNLRRQPEVRIRPKTVPELLLEAVPQRAKIAGDKLKLHLTGKTVISMKQGGDSYLLDWTGNEMIVSQVSDVTGDCHITLSESDLMKISTGDLNPQIMMLSHKVHVSGKTDHAMYVFNLIAPQTSI